MSTTTITKTMKKKKNITSFECEESLQNRLKKTAKAAGRTLSGHIRYVLEKSEVAK